MAEVGLTKNRIIAELSRSPHGSLKEYIPLVQQAAKQEPEFLAHLISWDRKKGQVRDAKVALPLISLSVPGFAPDLAENSLAHIAMLNPRELLKAFRFSLELRTPNHMRQMRRLVESYLREGESNYPKWERRAIQHRHVLKELYALAHLAPGGKKDSQIDNVLFNKGAYPAGSLFEAVANLKNITAIEAAGVIITRKIPFLIAQGALGKMAQEPDLVLALIGAMTPTELVTNTKMLERMGVKTNPALRAAFENAMERAADKGGTQNVFKTTRAAEAMTDEGLRHKLQDVQDKQLNKMAVEGNWLVLGDRSPSMVKSVEVAKHVAATLAKMVKGKVWLIFFDSQPQTIDVTGLSLDIIKKATAHINAGGSGTSIGCGLARMLDAKEEIDGIAIVSDGGENSAPRFPATYQKYSQVFGKEVPIYLYLCEGDDPRSLTDPMQHAGIDMQIFDLRGSKVDYVSLANLIATMRTNRYSLLDEIMATPLLKLSDVFKSQAEAVSA